MLFESEEYQEKGSSYTITCSTSPATFLASTGNDVSDVSVTPVAGHRENYYLPWGSWNRSGCNWLGFLSCLFFFSHFFLFWLLKIKKSYRMQIIIASLLFILKQLVLNKQKYFKNNANKQLTNILHPHFKQQYCNFIT